MNTHELSQWITNVRFRLLVLVLVALALTWNLSGCSTVVPVTQKLPEKPVELLKEPHQYLRKASANLNGSA